MAIRPIAIYLPQYHPIPENDEWWGKGFTEWTNVTKATPLFKDHYQPHLPADFGFYDLRLSEVREAQAAMAREYGIYGFCYYHYWFNGKRILERPFNEVLASGKPDFPFCLCWANENWTRTWDGWNKEVLLEQRHNLEDDKQHIKYLCSVFKDKRYIRVNDKPLFIVYRPELLADVKRTAELWRETAYKEGIGEIYLVCMHTGFTKINPEEINFDAAILFQPDFSTLSKPVVAPNELGKFFINKFFYRLKQKLPYKVLKYYNYKELAENNKNLPNTPYKLFPSITPMWDNTARKRSSAMIVHNSSPEVYEEWLANIIHNFKPYSPDENFIFINAWNEWAEGNHLEPDQKWGKQYLEATLNALKKNNG